MQIMITFYLINLDSNGRCKNNCFEIAGYMPDEIISKNMLDARLQAKYIFHPLGTLEKSRWIDGTRECERNV